MRKKIAITAFILLYGLVWTYQDLIKYGYMQAEGQLEVILNAVPIEKVLADSKTSGQIKAKIQLMQEIRQFAIDSIGLKDSDNYRTYYEQNGKDILWNLSACEPFQFKSVDWKFPILGSFSYKGFFDLKKAMAERTELDSQGYDTRIRTVSAWSTLGWFNDPILSNMLDRNIGSIADLIIHELTHSTIFVKDSITYNENLASFIGEQGARYFLISKYGKESIEYLEYVNRDTDYALYTRHMMKGYKALDSLYSTIKNEPLQTKEREKQKMIESIVHKIDTISFKNKKRFQGIFKDKLPNNAYFQSYERYTSKIDEFQQIMNRDFNGNLNAYVSYLKEK